MLAIRDATEFFAAKKHTMMKKALILCCNLLLFAACLKEPAAPPPALHASDPQLATNSCIARMLEMLPADAAPVLIDSAWTIAVFVTADDESGNFYKQIVVQDSSGAISLQLGGAQLFRQFPLGRKLYLEVQGLYIGSDHGLPQLGYLPAPDNAGVLQVSPLPASKFGQYIVPATLEHDLRPLLLSAADMVKVRPQLLNRLVTVQEVEVRKPDADNIYAEAGRSTNVVLSGCDATSFVLRSSGYARFAAAATARGNGSITGIYTVYDDVPQLVIRDTGDVHMEGLRCDGKPLSQPEWMSLQAVRALYQSKDVALPAVFISGTVISDAASGNAGSEGNIVLQQGSKGIVVYFGSTAAGVPALGDSITLNLSGATLTNYNGALEIKNIKTNKIRVVASGKTVEPVTLSIAQLNARFADYESVLVRIAAAKITNGGNYSGSKTLSDGSGEVTLFTASSASFANDRAPSITRSFQGIATPYGATKELKMRNPAIDVR
jgi:hypothetical protein